MSINFEGRVAIVTGAANGLGKSHALSLAKLGAKVVVNDFGGARDGTGGSSEAAEKVVAEIKAAGGEAIANGADVSSEEQVDHLRLAAVDPAVADERHADQDDAAEPQVERGQREPRECNRPSPELHRYHRDREAERQREQPVEDHSDAVGLEELHERVLGEDRVARGCPLQSEEESEHRVTGKRHEATPREEPTDLLMVGGRRPIGDRRREGADGTVAEHRGSRCRIDRRHRGRDSLPP
jgi:hypothetical protein